MKKFISILAAACIGAAVIFSAACAKENATPSTVPKTALPQTTAIKITAPQFNYATGDVAPEHVADVLGSSKILNSVLRTSNTPPKIIVEISNETKTFWVALVVHGKITKVDVQNRQFTLEEEGDSITLSVPSFAGIERGSAAAVAKNGGKGTKISLDQLNVGDSVWQAQVVINNERAEARWTNVN